MEQIDENGKCPLHPSMQLQSRKKNGEWRVLMTCCPLCVSGLPADGMSIIGSSASRYSRDDLNSVVDDENDRGDDGGGSRMEGRPAPSSTITEADDTTAPLSLNKVNSYDSGATTDDDASASSQNVYEDFRNFIEADQKGGQQTETLQTTTSSSQMPSNKVVGNSSRDSPKPQTKPPNTNNNNSKAYNSHDSPKPNRRTPKPKGSPRPMSPDPTQHYSPNIIRSRQQQLVMNQQQQHHHFPVPPHRKMNEQHQQQQYNNNSPQNPNRMGMNMKRPDPESIGHQGPFIHNDNVTRGYGSNNRVQMSPHQMSPQCNQHHHLTPQKQFSPPPYHTKLSPHQQQHMTPPPHPQTRQPPYYSTPKQTHDEISVNSSTRHKTTTRSIDPDEEISVSSMNSVKRNLYNSSPSSSLVHHNNTQSSSSLSPYHHRMPLEQDEVSAVSMSSVTRNLYKNKSNESSDDDDDDDSSSSNQDHNEENVSTTAQYDAKGLCLHHPTVRLRKKKLFGGWQIVLSNCPECCLDEIRKKVKKDDRSKKSSSKSKNKVVVSSSSKSSMCGSESGMSKTSNGTKKKKKKSGSSKKQHRRDKERKDPPMSQVDITGVGEDDKSIGTASTITISSYTHASHNGRTMKNWQEFTSEQGAGPACVTRMPFIDQHGERGWYTGRVDGTTGSPHGFGTMNFSNGVVAEGQWRNGLFVAEEDPPLVNSPAKVRYTSQQHQQHQGFVRKPSHHNVHAARSPLETHYEESSLSNNGGRSGSNARGQPHPQELTPMIHNQQQQQHRKVVCGMFWTTSAGNGAYTGEVNERNIPDGVGSMRYNSGMVAEGLWHDGEMTEDANEEDEDEVDDCRSYSDGNMLDLRGGMEVLLRSCDVTLDEMLDKYYL